MKAKIFSFLCKISGFAHFSKIRRKFYDLLCGFASIAGNLFFSRKGAKPQRFVKTFGFSLYSF
jgi:hypothetical protein